MFYNKYVTDLVLKLGGQTTKVIDKGSIELIGPFGLEKGLLNFSKNLSKLDTGVITSYALYILVGLTFYIVLPFFYVLDNNLLLIVMFGVLSIILHLYIEGHIFFTPPAPNKFTTLPLYSGWITFLGVSNFHWKLCWKFIYGTIISVASESATGWTEVFNVNESILL